MHARAQITPKGFDTGPLCMRMASRKGTCERALPLVSAVLPAMLPAVQCHGYFSGESCEIADPVHCYRNCR